MAESVEAHWSMWKGLAVAILAWVASAQNGSPSSTVRTNDGRNVNTFESVGCNYAVHVTNLAGNPIAAERLPADRRVHRTFHMSGRVIVSALPCVLNERACQPRSCAAGVYVTTTGQADALEYFKSTWSTDVRRCRVIQGFENETYAYACECGFGMWCDTNTALPRFCPAKYYCRTPARIKECKKDHYCKEGSTFGRRCSTLQSCPSGSSRPEDSGGPVLVFVSLTLLALLIFKVVEDLRAKSRDRANADMEDYLDRVRETLALEDADLIPPKNGDVEKLDVEMQPVKAPKEAFLIEFDNIRYTLPNGVTIMRGPSGRFAPGRTTAIMGASGENLT